MTEPTKEQLFEIALRIVGYELSKEKAAMIYRIAQYIQTVDDPTLKGVLDISGLDQNKYKKAETHVDQYKEIL